MIQKYRKHILIVFGVLSIVSAFFLTQLKFTFDFEQFFPEGDEDLTFFRNFTAEFETDDNFLLLAIESDKDVFDSTYLSTFHKTSLALKDIEFITSVQSLTTMRYPIKTPFGISSVPMIHIDEPDRYGEDKLRILQDKRFVGNLINKDATALVALVKTKDRLSVEESKELMIDIKSLLKTNNVLDKTRMLGRAYFQTDLIEHQKKEVLYSGFISMILISIILFLIFRRIPGIFIALGSISLSLLIFMGFMGATGRELSIMAALYPVLMLIVGTSDVIHIMSKYVDELNKGKSRFDAINISMKEIGMATFLTSITTAIGFATLLTSKLQPLRDFGVNAAIGVMIAYITTILITPALLSYFEKDKITKLQNGSNQSKWDILVNKIYEFSKAKPSLILITSGLLLLLCYYGITKVTTNYNVEDNLPIGQPITADFLYFEKEFSGFRPLEFAITTKNGYKADDYKVVQEIDKLETKLEETSVINSILSQATLYKSVNRMNQGNTAAAYKFPENEEDYYAAKRIVDKIASTEATVLINKNNDKTRLSSKIVDIGADKIKTLGLELDSWVNTNLDTSIISVKRTGTGLIIDKNSEYVIDSLVKGLGLALLLISIVMAFLLKSWTFLILAFIPNIIPVIFGGALLGYFGVDLEAGVSIVFAVIFGIAVDDTIHFFSRFKLCQMKGMNLEDSIRVTFTETGKAIIFTTIILFFGFLVMLFSSSPPTKTVGALISVTLIAALLADIFLLPVLMRMVLKDKTEVAPSSKS